MRKFFHLSAKLIDNDLDIDKHSSQCILLANIAKTIV